MQRLLNRIRSVLGFQVLRSSSGLLTARDPLERRIYSVCHEADERGIDALTPAQQAVVLAWEGRGIIGNGGFKYFYEGEWRMAKLAAAYRALGFPDAAQACERSLTIFPGGTPPRDAVRRCEYMGPESLALFCELEDAVFNVDWAELRVALGVYMDNHSEDFAAFP